MCIKCKIVSGNLKVIEKLDKIINSSISLHSYLKTYFVIKETQLSRNSISDKINSEIESILLIK